MEKQGMEETEPTGCYLWGKKLSGESVVEIHDVQGRRHVGAAGPALDASQPISLTNTASESPSELIRALVAGGDGLLSDCSQIASSPTPAVGTTRRFERSLRSEAANAVTAAVTDERRRLARELHDSVAQELAFIFGQSERLAQEYSGERALADIASAAAHALDALRSTIRGFLSASSCSLGEAVQARARELASRAGLGLTLDIDSEIASSAELQHGVLSIMQEAISNAARHAGATSLEISVRELGETLLVRISDDGQGFDPAHATPSTTGGFGLWSMQDRARALGGVLRIKSKPGRGTTVELEV